MNIVELQTILQNRFDKYEWSVPPDLNLGILTTNYAFRAKDISPNPKEAAIKIAELVQKYCDDLSLDVVVKSVGPYVNVEMGEKEYRELFDVNYGFKLEQKAEILLIDYVGANVAKELHAGHMRNLNIGDSLRRILSLKYKVITDNHWGDWGVNMGTLIWGWKQEGNLKEYEINPIKELSRVYIWANSQKDIVENYNSLVRDEFFKLEQKDSENYNLWQKFILTTKQNLTKDLELMKIPKFDLEQGESFYEPDMKLLFDFMEEYEIWQKDGLARYFDFDSLVEKWCDLDEKLKSKISGFGRVYLISSTGYTTYCFRDIAARLQWARDHNVDIMVSVTDKTQRHNFDQAFAVICYLSNLIEFQKIQSKKVISRLQWSNLVHIGYGFLTLKDGKMSSRKGNVLTLREMFDNVKESAKISLTEKSPHILESNLEDKSVKLALAALKWYDLNRGIEEDLVLDIPQILKFEGNTGIYQLYTVARINSIFKKNMIGGDMEINSWEFNLDQFNVDEKILLKKMYILPLILEQICVSYKPHLLCNHLFELATLINSWYAKFSVSNEQNLDRKKALICMCLRLKQHLYFGLDLLGIEAVDEM